jgi:hypothetical protein
LIGQAGVVSSMANETSPPSIFRFVMKPRSTMLLPKSGSMIGRRASKTAAGVTELVMVVPEIRETENSANLRRRALVCTRNLVPVRRDRRQAAEVG